MNRRIAVTTIACLSLISAVVFPSAAFALPAEPEPFSDMTQAEVDAAMIENFGADSENMFVLDESTAVKSGNEVFYPMPADAKNSLKISSELAADLGLKSGEVPQSQSRKVANELLDMQSKAKAQQEKTAGKAPKATAALNCRNTFFTPALGAWTGWINSRCSLIGNIDGRKPYSFAVQAGTNTQACGEGIGFTWKGGTSPGTIKKSYGLGCGSSGGYSAPWQNVAGYPQFRAKSSYLGLLTSGVWY